jgi:hypothetical protein
MLSFAKTLEEIERTVNANYSDEALRRKVLRDIINRARAGIRAKAIKTGKLVSYAISLGNDTVQKVDGRRIGPNTALHKNGKWVATHLPSGTALVKADTKARAVFVAKEFERHCPNASAKTDVFSGAPKHLLGYLREMVEEAPLASFTDWLESNGLSL